MPELIKNGRIVNDDWQTVFLAEGETAATISLSGGRLIVPLAVWSERQDELRARDEIGVWLDGSDDPASIAPDLDRLSIVAIHFPKFADGRGYSSATLLRRRHGYRGELRAIGAVLRDQFDYLTRCGFDALQPAAGHYSTSQLQAALASLSDFTEPYQASVTPVAPLFRRVRRAA